MHVYGCIASRALTRADVRGEAKQTDRHTRQPANLQSPPHTYSAGRMHTQGSLTVDKDFTLSVQPHNGMDVSRNDKDTDPCSI
eukprot:jgi/Chrzof1/11484/UNPLg00416.t1